MLLFAGQPGEVDSDNRLLAHIKCNVGPHAPTLRFHVEERAIETANGESITTSRLAWLGEDRTTRVADLLVPNTTDSDRSERDVACDVLLDALHQGDKPWAELAGLVEDEGVSERTARRARDELKQLDRIATRKDGMTGGWFWYVATEVDQQSPNLATPGIRTTSIATGQVLEDPTDDDADYIQEGTL